MPTPHPGQETHDEWMERCIPAVLDDGAASSNDQAVAMCAQMWRDATKEFRKGDAMSIIRKERTSDTAGLDFVLSDETKDRMGDVIRADGWILNNFKRNPIALFGHRADFPIGNWKNLRIEKKALLGTLELAPEGTSERIDEMSRLVQAGILKAVSVGFRDLESRPLNKDDPFKGIEFLKQELIETSLVSVPANPNALGLMKSLNISDDVRRLVFAEHGSGSKPTRRKDHIGEYAKLTAPDEWSPGQARKAKLWLRDLARMHPYNTLYRKMYRLMDEIETVRTVSLVVAEQGRKTRDL